MLQVITFCDQTIDKLNEEVEKTKVELHAKLDRNEREEIISTIEKNDELNRKHLQQRNLIMLNLNLNINSPQKKTKLIHTEKRTNEHYKLSCVLKRRSNTYL